MKLTYTKVPTDYTCWLHRGVMLYWVEFSDEVKEFYCPDCDGPSHPPSS